jgi:hypothetical protein
MALVVADRVWETTSTSGTGTLTLSGALSGYQTFAVIGNGNTTYYTITNGVDWEVGIGTYTSSGTTLSRDTVLASSLGGTTKITVTPGSFVFCDYPASRAVYENEIGNVDGYPITNSTISGTRITNRIGSNGGTTSGNITPTGNTADQYNITGLTGTANIQIPSGTPTDGQRLTIRIKDNGTGRTLTWVTTAGGYRVIGTTLPLTTTANKTIYVGCVYNVADSFWDVVAVASEV